MEIELGKKVFSSDGKHVGHVDSLVIDYNTRDIQSIISRSGVMLSVDRIIPLEAVDSIDDEHDVHLSISADEVKRQQQFMEREFRVANQDETKDMPQTWLAASGQMPLYYGVGDATLGYNNDSTIYRTSALDAPDMEVESNLPEWEGRLDSGTDVVGSDGKKIGTVEDVDYDATGKLTGFVVKAGFLFHHDVSIPMNWIESIAADTVILNITADQAKKTHDTA